MCECACLCADELKRCKLRKKQTLCRPNRAAFLPPQSPQWGDETSQIFNDHRQAEIFKLRVGRVRWLVLATVIAPLKTVSQRECFKLIAPLGEVV